MAQLSLRHIEQVILAIFVVQWNLSKTATCGPVLTGLYGEVGCSTVGCNALMLFGAGEAGCFSELAA